MFLSILNTHNCQSLHWHQNSLGAKQLRAKTARRQTVVAETGRQRVSDNDTYQLI